MFDSRHLQVAALYRPGFLNPLKGESRETTPPLARKFPFLLGSNIRISTASFSPFFAPVTSHSRTDYQYKIFSQGRAQSERQPLWLSASLHLFSGSRLDSYSGGIRLYFLSTLETARGVTSRLLGRNHAPT